MAGVSEKQSLFVRWSAIEIHFCNKYQILQGESDTELQCLSTWVKPDSASFTARAATVKAEYGDL